MGRPPERLGEDAQKALLWHSWPGNVRELRNVLERAAILSDDGVIERRHLSLHAKTVPPASAKDLTAMERQTIEKRCARAIGIRRRRRGGWGSRGRSSTCGFAGTGSNQPPSRLDQTLAGLSR
jgi:DNA-binding NtrC family response regulator